MRLTTRPGRRYQPHLAYENNSSCRRLVALFSRQLFSALRPDRAGGVRPNGRVTRSRARGFGQSSSGSGGDPVARRSGRGSQDPGPI